MKFTKTVWTAMFCVLLVSCIGNLAHILQIGELREEQEAYNELLIHYVELSEVQKLIIAELESQLNPTPLADKIN